MDNCAFYLDSFFGITAYVDIRERVFFGLLPGGWKVNQPMGYADGPWWDTFRQALALWEVEITLPENAPGWDLRESRERDRRDYERREAERARKVKQANRLFRP